VLLPPFLLSWSPHIPSFLRLYAHHLPPNPLVSHPSPARPRDHPHPQAEFDSSWIVDLRERPLLPAAGGRAVPATHVSPLTEEAGSMVLTDAHLYFQPLHAVAAEPVR
jgi:hypothetical protein